MQDIIRLAQELNARLVLLPPTNAVQHGIDLMSIFENLIIPKIKTDNIEKL